MTTTAPRLEQPAPDRAWPAHAEAEGRGHEWGFVLQAVTGILVIGLVTAHMIANHFVVPGGLRDFAAVVAYLSSPVIAVLEVAFLVTVTTHALLGVRAILFDLGWSARTERRITRALALLGIVTVGYGLWLTGLITAQG